MYIWPEQFITGEVRQPETLDEKLSLCATALSGWALCSVDNAPDNFGKAMAKVHEYLGDCDLDSLMVLSNRLMKLRTETLNQRIKE